jgi:hypothetical protein
MPEFESFEALTEELYTDCTREQKVGLYLQHHPLRAVPFILELLELTHPETKESADDNTE